MSSRGCSGQTPDIDLTNPSLSEFFSHHVRGGASRHYIVNYRYMCTDNLIEMNAKRVP